MVSAHVFMLNFSCSCTNVNQELMKIFWCLRDQSLVASISKKHKSFNTALYQPLDQSFHFLAALGAQDSLSFHGLPENSHRNINDLSPIYCYIFHPLIKQSVKLLRLRNKINKCYVHKELFYRYKKKPQIQAPTLFKL